MRCGSIGANISVVCEKWSVSVLFNQEYRELSVITIKVMEYYDSMEESPS
jgi:hypothetical protein